MIKGWGSNSKALSGFRGCLAREEARGGLKEICGQTAHLGLLQTPSTELSSGPRRFGMSPDGSRIFIGDPSW